VTHRAASHSVCSLALSRRKAAGLTSSLPESLISPETRSSLRSRVKSRQCTLPAVTGPVRPGTLMRSRCSCPPLPAARPWPAHTPARKSCYLSQRRYRDESSHLSSPSDVAVLCSAALRTVLPATRWRPLSRSRPPCREAPERAQTDSHHRQHTIDRKCACGHGELREECSGSGIHEGAQEEEQHAGNGTRRTL